MGRILLVEDDPGVADALSIFFNALGHQVRVASTVTLARQFMEASAPDLLIADERLTDGRGSDLMQWAAVRHEPVARILLTAGNEQEVGPLPPGTLIRHKPWDIAEAERTLDALLPSSSI